MMKKWQRLLAVLLSLALLLGAAPPAGAADGYLTAEIATSGTQVTAGGTTTPSTDVTLLVERLSDNNKSHMDQVRSGPDGAYAFRFKLEVGSYRATFTSNGLTVQRDFTLQNITAKKVTVRVEGAVKTLLSQVQVSIMEGETTLLEAVVTALQKGGVSYELENGLLHKIAGEEGWQWLVNGQGGMALPGDLLQGGDDIVLVDDALWDPVLTRLTASAEAVPVGETFTVTLYQGSGATPASGQTVWFDGKAQTTDKNGQATFSGKAEGNYYITAQTSGSLIRPVPLAIRIGKPLDEPIPDPRYWVDMRIEGYKKTHFNDVIAFDPAEYLDAASGKYVIKDPDGNKHSFDYPTVLLATIAAWNKGRIKDNKVSHNDNYVARMAGEEEFDFQKEHPTCGWLVRVNGILINQGVGVWEINNGDEVDWYYGDLESSYGELEVSPRTVDPGEKISVQVTGRANDEGSFGSSGQAKPIKDAIVYVGSKEYTTDAKGQVQVTMMEPGTYQVYAVKLDKNSKQGNYYFPLMSRTDRVEVTVRGGEVVVPVPEDPALADDLLREILDSGNPSAELVAAAIQAAAQSLEKALPSVKTEEEAKQLLGYTADVSGLLDEAVRKIDTAKAAAAALDGCGRLSGVLAGVAPQTGKNDGATLARATAETLAAAGRLLSLLSAADAVESTTMQLLDNGAKILSCLQGQEARTVEAGLVSLARAAAAALSRQELPRESMAKDGDLSSITIEPTQAARLAQEAARAAARLQAALAQAKVEVNRQLGGTVTLVAPAQGETRVQVALAPGALEQAAAEGAGRLQVLTSVASFSMGSATFGPPAQGQTVTLSAARLQSGQLPAGTGLAAGSVAVSLEASANGQPLASFREPLQAGIPYGGTAKNNAAVTVFQLKEDGSAEPIGGLYDPASGLVIFPTSHFSTYFAKESLGSFQDLGKYDWAAEAIRTLAGKGIISGKGANSFDPGASITRAEFVTLISKMLRCEASGDPDLPFRDVPEGRWYRPAVAAAYQQGLVSGKSAESFDPGGHITRQEMAVIIAKVLQREGYLPAAVSHLGSFSDQGAVASWAKEGAALAVREGIISGKGAGSFDPGANATRAEAAVMLYKLYKLVLP